MQEGFTLKYERKEINNYLVQYKLVGEDKKFDRMSMYNDILFFNLSYLTGKKQKSVVIINENNSGGLIFANPRFVDKIIQNLQKFNSRYDISTGKQIMNVNKKVVKVSFRMDKKVRTWKH